MTHLLKVRPLKWVLALLLVLLLSFSAAAVLATDADAMYWDGFAEACAMDGGIHWADPTGNSYCMYDDGYIMCDAIGGWCDWRSTRSIP